VITDHYDQILTGPDGPVPARPSENILDMVCEKYAHSNPFLPVTHFIDHATMGA
jgi:hypothetical protein